MIFSGIAKVVSSLGFAQGPGIYDVQNVESGHTGVVCMG